MIIIPLPVTIGELTLLHACIGSLRIDPMCDVSVENRRKDLYSKIALLLKQAAAAEDRGIV